MENESITELQMRMAFQDELLEALNTAVSDQQRQILRLEEKIAGLASLNKQLQADMQALAPEVGSAADSGIMAAETEPPPPHY